MSPEEEQIKRQLTESYLARMREAAWAGSPFAKLTKCEFCGATFFHAFECVFEGPVEENAPKQVAEE